MAYVYANNSTPAKGYFSICCKHGKYRIKTNPEGTVLDMPLSNVTHPRDIISVLKYHTQCMGLNTVAEGVTIDIASIRGAEAYKGNPTMCVIDSSLGRLFIKKINRATCHSGLYNYIIPGGYNLLASMYGYVNLVNDKHFDQGVIIEQCFPVKEMTIPKILHGLSSLDRYHKLNMGIIHGDCNPTNIMADKYDNLKLVDPVNLIEQQVRYRNADYYDDLEPKTELNAFVFSCFELAADILKCDIKEVCLNVKEELMYPEITNGVGTPFSTVFEINSDYDLIELSSKLQADNIKLYDPTLNFDEDYETRSDVDVIQDLDAIRDTLNYYSDDE